MDRSRLALGEMVAAGSGAALLFIMSVFPWFSASKGVGDRDAWETFTQIDLVLFAVLLTALGMAVAQMARINLRSLPVPPGRIVAMAGAIAVLLIVLRLLVLPEIEIQAPDGTTIETDVGHIRSEIGAYLGLIASAGIAVGGYTAEKWPASRHRRRR